MESNPLHSCSSAASSFLILVDGSQLPTQHMKELVPPRTGHSSSGKPYEKLLDGVQMKSDALQFQTAVNVSVLQGYTEQC